MEVTQVTFRNVSWGRCEYVSVALHFVTFHIMTNMKLYGGYASNVSQRYLGKFQIRFSCTTFCNVSYHDIYNVVRRLRK